MRDGGRYAQTDLPFVRGSETSLMAAEAAEESGLPQVQRERLMGAFEAAGLNGLTDQEAQRRTGLPGDSQRPRRDELRAAGLIEPFGSRLTRSGRWARVWRLRSLG